MADKWPISFWLFLFFHRFIGRINTAEFGCSCSFSGDSFTSRAYIYNTITS
jgi:hypothetical protein